MLKLAILLTVTLISASAAAVANAREAKAYPMCEQKRLDGGEILYLSRDKRVDCWKEMTYSVLKRTDLSIKGGSYRFVYVFGDDDLDDVEFDPIFNVKVKEIPSDDYESTSNGMVELYRKSMINLCDERSLNFFKEKFHFTEFSRKDLSGADYNDYHLGKKNTPPQKLDNFHVYFRDSRGKCVLTDSGELRRLFAIDDVAFEEKPRLMAFFDSLLGRKISYAKGKDGEILGKITVEIARGAFRTGLFTGSFSIPANRDYSIIVNDLSTYSLYDGRRRQPLHFKIAAKEPLKD